MFMRGLGWGLGLVSFVLACGDDAVSGRTEDGSGSTSSSTGTGTGSNDIGSTEASSSESTGEPDPSGETGSTGESEGESSESSSSTGIPNEPPTAENDRYWTNTLALTLTIDALDGLLANDGDPEGDAVTIDAGTQATEAGGTVTIAADGSFVYVAPTEFWGDDHFEYTIEDAHGGSDTARVRIVVAPTLEPAALLVNGRQGFAIDGELTLDRSGYAVGGGGDVNGDGLDDVVVGADQANAVGVDEGKAYVVLGRTAGPVTELANVASGVGGFAILGEAEDDEAGAAVAIAGDVNGDGLADVIVGAPRTGGNGRAYVVFGTASTAPVALADVAAGNGGFVIQGAPSGAELGFAVAGAGDVNGDGLADVIVGAPLFEQGRGLVAIVFGKASGTAVSVATLGTGSGSGIVLTGEGGQGRAGTAVDGGGDVNGDGLDDVVIGAPNADPGNVGSAGRAYVVFGRSTDAVLQLASVAAGTGGYALDGEGANQLAGSDAALAGDVNGDGRADVIVGAPGWSRDDAQFTGRAYVAFGKADGALVPLATIGSGLGNGIAFEGQAAGDLVGSAVAGAGDIDGDGLADLVIGIDSGDFAAGSAGRTYVAFGRSTPALVPLGEIASGQQGFAFDGTALLDRSGWAVNAAGDVDGDGYDDLVFTAYSADPPGRNNAGRTYVAVGGDYRLRSRDGSSGPGDDLVLGTADADILVGGRGDDVLVGLGGADVLRGGPGDDVLAIGDIGFRRLDGGTGIDTLRIDIENGGLDLRDYTNVHIADVERVDLVGHGNNQLFLGVEDLRSLSSTSNTLTVEGEAGDQVIAELTGAGFVDEGVADGYARYGNGLLVLRVAAAVQVFAQL